MRIISSMSVRWFAIILAAMFTATITHAETRPHQEFPVALQTARIDGLTIRYARAPREGAETVVLLSPWPESLFAFLPIWAELSERYDVLAIDLPGFGRSEGRPNVIAPEAMGNFVVEAVRHFGLDKPHVVGPDIGTSTLLFAAANHPEVFGSITIGSGAVAYPLEVGSSLKWLIELPSLDALQNIDIGQRIGSVLATQRNPVPGFVRDDYIASYSGPGRYAESARLVRRYPQELPILKQRLAGIRVPVLVIAGRDDPFVPVSNGHYLVDQLPNARLEIVDSGHFVWEDAPATYASHVAAWVEAHRRR